MQVFVPIGLALCFNSGISSSWQTGTYFRSRTALLTSYVMVQFSLSRSAEAVVRLFRGEVLLAPAHLLAGLEDGALECARLFFRGEDHKENLMPAFPGVDFLDFDSLLNDEELLARKTARQFVEERVIPIIAQHNREATFPMELVPQLGELGFFGANLKGYGCAEMSNVAYGLVMQELERGDSGLRSFVSVQSALVMYPIHTYGSPEQKEKWLPRMQSGDALGCFGLTEPQFGSNPGGMLMRAVRRGHCYVLNGEKMWITNGSLADVALVWAKGEDGRIRGFLVEKGTPGFKAWDVHGKLSLRASITSGLSFTDCEIPAENMLPGVEGLRGPLSCLTQARYGIGWGTIGAAMACYQTALEYAKTRRQFGNKAIAGHQLVQDKLVCV